MFLLRYWYAFSYRLVNIAAYATVSVILDSFGEMLHPVELTLGLTDLISLYILSSSFSNLTAMVLSPDFSEENEVERDEVAQDDSLEVTGSPSPPAPQTPVVSILPGPGSRCD